MIRKKAWKSAVTVLCIILIVAYASILFLPHAHKCVGADCSVCALIETSRNTLADLALAAVIYQLANIKLAIPSAHDFMPSGHDDTPVGLKVKLSD